MFRITSTYVEKTQLIKMVIIIYGDHLHIRGENISNLINKIVYSGSPPHTWRKRKADSAAIARLRITSTYVEKT